MISLPFPPTSPPSPPPPPHHLPNGEDIAVPRIGQQGAGWMDQIAEPWDSWDVSDHFGGRKNEGVIVQQGSKKKKKKALRMPKYPPSFPRNRRPRNNSLSGKRRTHGSGSCLS